MSFPRFRFLATVTARLQRDFKRQKVNRTTRKNGLSENDQDFLDTYEYQLEKVWEHCGQGGLEDVFRDLATILGVPPPDIRSHFRALLTELKDPPSKRPVITRDSSGLHITLNLGDLISKEIDARLQLVTNKNHAVQTRNRGETVEIIDDSDVEGEERSGSWEVKQVAVPTIGGVTVPVAYVNDIDTAVLPTNWVFLSQNEGKEDVPTRTCRCNPLLEGCRESRICPCAQLTVAINPGGVSLYTNQGEGKTLSPVPMQFIYECSASCTCTKDTCALSYLNEGMEQIHERSFAVKRKKEQSWTSLITLAPIDKDEFVLEVTGEVITAEELTRREANGAPLFAVPLIHKYIDISTKGNWTRFLSHSCEPTLIVTRAADQYSTRVLLFASRALSRGDELTVNVSHLWMLRSRMQCDCGAKTCKGFIGTG